MSVKVKAYRAVVAGIPPLGTPMEEFKIFRKGQLSVAIQWARDRAAERGAGAEIHVHPGNCLVWHLRARTGKETLRRGFAEGQMT